MTAVPDGVEWVVLSFVDVFGVGHSLQLPAARFDAAVARGEPFDGSALEGRARRLEADMLLRPDPATVVPTSTGLARAVCTVLTRDGSPWRADPRTNLERIAGELEELSTGWTASAELELYLLDADGRPVDRGGYFDQGEYAGMAVVRAAAGRLATLGVTVEACHHEAGPGQYEIDLAPLGPVALADALILAKQVVREVAGEHGCRATFMPRPFDGEAGSGMHLHQRSALLLDPDGKLTPDGRWFVAGQLAHARGLCALAAPTVNSYKRLHSGPEAPGAVVWAHANRAALVRVSSYLGEAASLEFRGADPSANPYLLVAGLLVTGASGIESELDLDAPLDEDERGIDHSDAIRFDPLPRDLDDALDALAADDVLVDAFDAELLSRLADGRRAEAHEYRSHVTDWERRRYLDE
ncbi:MAG TPA: glutamine synthetase family protein [Acidimicrobiales bacterium]|nr:glutamine synthetase family protein [Acidimicrobiales bacterium]